MILGPRLSTSAVRHSRECQRVVRVLIRAADGEFDVPGERRRSHVRIECCNRDASESREHIDAVGVRVVAAVVEDIKRELSRRCGVNDQVPRAGDNGTSNLSAATVERATRKRAMVRLCRRRRRGTG